MKTNQHCTRTQLRCGRAWRTDRLRGNAVAQERRAGRSNPFAMSVALIGLPTDSNSSFARGPAKAPQAIRREMWSEQGNTYSESGVNLASPGILIDSGDVDLREDEGDVERIELAIENMIVLDRRPLSLGGDHSVTYPIVRAVARRFPSVTIVHFDAHPDLYPVFQGNPLSHACPFARILEVTGVRIVQIGIRTMTPPQQALATKYGVQVFAPWDLQKARAALPDGPVYVTLDLDGLDPAFAPGVSHREPGGLSVRDVLDTVALIPGTVIGADVVEYNPERDIDNITASVAAKCAREFAARMYTDGVHRRTV